MTNTENQKKNIFAAIDIGTNAARLKIVEIIEVTDSPLKINVLYEERDAIRPGQGVFSDRNIHSDAQLRLITTLKKYKKAIDGFSVPYLAVATASFRAAENGDQTVKLIKEKTGLDLQIIDGLEEARLVCMAALYSQKNVQNEVIIDIGGGSTEICFTDGVDIDKSWSLHLGALLLNDNFKKNKSQAKGKRLHLMRAFVDRICRLYLKSKFIAKIKNSPIKKALGTSGSIRALEKFIDPLRHGINQAQVRTALIRLAKMTQKEREQHFPPARAEVIVSAAAILLGIMEFLDIECIYAVNGSLKDGILWHMYDLELQKSRKRIEKDKKKNQKDKKKTVTNKSINYSTDPLLRKAEKLVQHFSNDHKHAQHCQKLAGELFDLFVGQHHLEIRNKQLLEAAALMHDIGHAINSHKHHRHSEYIVENTEFPQVSRREHRILAKLCRYHRKRLPKKGHEAITELDTQEITILHLLFPLLRLADALDRSHRGLVKNMSAEFEKDRVTLLISVKDKAVLEVWAAQKLASVFQLYYHLDLKIKIVK